MHIVQKVVQKIRPIWHLNSTGTTMSPRYGITTFVWWKLGLVVSMI